MEGDMLKLCKCFPFQIYVLPLLDSFVVTCDRKGTQRERGRHAARIPGQIQTQAAVVRGSAYTVHLPGELQGPQPFDLCDGESD